MISDIVQSQFAWGGKGMDKYLNKKFGEYDLSLVGVINPDGREQNTHASTQWSKAWPEIKDKIDWQSLKADPRSWTTIIPKPGSDLVLGVIPVDEGTHRLSGHRRNSGAGTAPPARPDRARP